MTDYLIEKAITATERGWIPESVVRFGIRRLCAERLSGEQRKQGRSGSSALEALVEQMSRGPIAISTADANLQHYEQPAELFILTLGPRLKYSCCYWPSGVRTLGEAEERALEETCRRARIEDGMDVLELGCGWGSLTLWVASRYPGCRVTAVSNSREQRRHVERTAAEQGLENVRVITADMNDFDTPERFDRVVSVEMFEHMNNYRELLRRVAGWMRCDGLLFIHVFAHRRYAYRYQSRGASDWMARNFFTGGVMPSKNFIPKFQDDLRLLKTWWWSGRHYRRTAEAWLENLASNRERVLRVLAEGHGAGEARLWYRRWQLFYLACAELWGFENGAEWGVGHYLFGQPGATRSPDRPELEGAFEAETRRCS